MNGPTISPQAVLYPEIRAKDFRARQSFQEKEVADWMQRGPRLQTTSDMREVLAFDSF